METCGSDERSIRHDYSFWRGLFCKPVNFHENELEIGYFIDNDDKKAGTCFWGYEVKKPESIIGKEYQFIVLTSKKYAAEMKKQLQDMGVENNRIVNAWDLRFLENDSAIGADCGKPLNCISELKVRNQKDYQKLRVNDEMIEMEEIITKMVIKSPKKRIYYPGVCQVCRKEVNLLIDNQYSEGPEKVNLRERLVCPICWMCNRQHVMAREVMDAVSVDKVVYLTEQVTQCIRF